MEYLDGFVGHPIKYFVRETNERDDLNARPLLDLLSTLRPSADTPHDDGKPILKRNRYGRILRRNERQNFVEIAQGLVSVDDPHVRRCFAKTASTSSWVAKRPSPAA